MRCQGWQQTSLLIVVLLVGFAQSAVAQQADAGPKVVARVRQVRPVAQPRSFPERLPATSPNVGIQTAYQAPAAGADDGSDIQQLLQRLEAAESDLAELRGKKAEPVAPPTEITNVEDVTALKKRVVDLEKAALASKNKLPFVKLGGFFQLDTGYFEQNAQSKTTLGDIQDGTGFRRTRLQAFGSVTEFTNYILEMDFAIAGRPSFFDVWVEQKNLGWLGTVRIGHFRQPTTMDGLTSIRHLDFLERNASFQAFDPFRRVGIMSYNTSEDENTTWQVSAYRTNFSFWNGVATQYNDFGDTRFATLLADNGGYSAAVRATHLLWYDEPAEGRYLLHVGGGYNYSNIGNTGAQGTSPISGAPFYEARTIPEFFVGDPGAGGNTTGGTPFVVDSGRFSASSFNLFHASLAGQWGPAHFQTEWLGTTINQIGAGTVFYNGAYIQCGYYLTGENAGYNRQFGVMDYTVKPFTDFFGVGRRKGICGWGAWEVAFRWSYLNMVSNNLAPAQATPDTNGLQPTVQLPGSAVVPNPGVLNESTVALNWWWNQYTRVQFNWIHSMLNEAPVAPTVLGVPITRGFASLDVFAARIQLEF